VPVPPAEVTIAPGEDRAVRAGRQAAAETGLALDAGPTTTALSGTRQEILDALRGALDAALCTGATTVEVKLEFPRDAREDVERAGSASGARST
jgi:uncharacterized protein YqgV (UPF0045/DUF77 family)